MADGQGLHIPGPGRIVMIIINYLVELDETGYMYIVAEEGR